MILDSSVLYLFLKKAKALAPEEAVNIRYVTDPATASHVKISCGDLGVLLPVSGYVEPVSSLWFLQDDLSHISGEGTAVFEVDTYPDVDGVYEVLVSQCRRIQPLQMKEAEA